MIELYHFWDSFCSFKVRLCLEEKGLPWNSHHVDLMKFENLRPDYLAINPKGLVPTLLDGAAPIPESSIVNEYLDDAYPELPLRPRDASDCAKMRLWVRHEEDVLFIAVRPASLNLMMKQIFWTYTEQQLDGFLRHHPNPDAVTYLKKVFHEPYDPNAVAKSRKMLTAAFRRMEAGLATSPWLAGKTYSLADIAAAPVVDRVERLGMSEVWDALPAVRDWIDRLTSRPAYQRSRPPDAFRMPARLNPENTRGPRAEKMAR